ncbi:MAG: hypothetical protein H8E48_06515 [Chloroflexi bacterium]|nr:hypothetical protein [Chloroflexota bacterium]
MFIGILANRKHALTGLFLVLAVALFLAVSSANSAYAEHEDFVGHEPPVCDILEFDGPLNGEISGNTASTVAKMQATFNQFGCRITGELEIVSRSFAGSGPFYGIVDGNALRFTVTSETSDAPRDLNFSGVIHGKIIKGQYSIPHTRLVGEWGLIVPEQKTVTQLTSLRDQASNFQLVAVIRELQARLSELRQERTELVADLEHQVRIESEDIIHRWDLAIEDLKADFEHEIDL